MVADGLLTRQRYREVPPRVDYELTDRARDLLPILGAVARWGLEWSWSAPRSGEEINIGAILRLAPGLLSLPRSVSGTVEARVTGKGGAACVCALVIRRGRVEIEEREAPEADATVGGSQRAWVDAFKPDGARGGLRIEGNRGLVEALLDGYGAAAARASAAA